MCTVAFQAGISRSTTLPTPAVDFRAADYVEGATSWTNRGSTGGTGTIPTGGMNKTSSGVDAVIFGGKTSNDRVSASIGSTSAVDQVTVEMWVKLLDNGSTENNFGSMLFSWATPTLNAYNVYHYQDQLGYNTIRSELYGVNSGSYNNSWKHLTFVMSDTGTETAQKIYVDGVAQTMSCRLGTAGSTGACGSTAGVRVFDSNGNFLLMDNPYSSSTWLAKAEVAMVRVYAQELTASEVLAAYNATNSLPTVTTTSTSTTTTSTSTTSTTSTTTTTTTAPATTTTVQSSTTTSIGMPSSTTVTATTVNTAPSVTTPATATGGSSTATASTTAPFRQTSQATTTTVSPPPTRAPTPTTSTTTSTTTSVPAQVPGNAPVDDVPELTLGESEVTIGGRSVDIAVRRDGDTLTASFGDVTLQMSVVTPDGTVRSLGERGVLTLDPGSELAVVIAGLEPESSFEGWIYSTPMPLGQARASAGGLVETSLQVPETVTSGRHTVVLTGTESSGEPFIFYGAVQSGDSSASSRWLTLALLVPLVFAGCAAVFLPPVLRRRRR